MLSEIKEIRLLLFLLIFKLFRISSRTERIRFIWKIFVGAHGFGDDIS